MIIYPSIDLRGGRVVRLRKGRAAEETVYFDEPSEPAGLWRDAGAEWIHVVDLDGAFTGVARNDDAVRQIVATGMRVQLGGGLRSGDDIERALALGVDRVVVGTRAAEDLDAVKTLADTFGNRLAVGIDARDGRVAVKGWVEVSDILATDLAAEVVARGVATIIYTDISRDGMLSGPNIEGFECFLAGASCDVIASGGVAERGDVERLQAISRDRSNLNGVIIGRALYEQTVDLADLIRLAAC
jgi:phosphoribosylformimino-5-aminoimidazole carboxamide ribotide isomerase